MVHEFQVLLRAISVREEQAITAAKFRELGERHAREYEDRLLKAFSDRAGLTRKARNQMADKITMELTQVEAEIVGRLRTGEGFAFAGPVTMIERHEFVGGQWIKKTVN